MSRKMLHIILWILAELSLLFKSLVIKICKKRDLERLFAYFRVIMNSKNSETARSWEIFNSFYITHKSKSRAEFFERLYD